MPIEHKNIKKKVTSEIIPKFSVPIFLTFLYLNDNFAIPTFVTFLYLNDNFSVPK